jgi:hypothetical protein
MAKAQLRNPPTTWTMFAAVSQTRIGELDKGEVAGRSLS